MRDYLLGLTAAVSVCLSTSIALAQDTAPVVVDDATISAGSTQEETAVGSRYIVETNGDWELQCTKMPEGQADRCVMFQMLTDSIDNPTAEFNIAAISTENGIVMLGEVLAPLETLLTKGVRLSVDGSEPKLYPFQTCAQIGCLSRMSYSAEQMDQFKRGAAGEVVIIPYKAPDHEVKLTLSLKGFTATFDAMMAKLDSQ